MTPWIEIDVVRCTLAAAERRALEPLIHDVLFEYMARQCALGEADATEPMTLTLTKAAEILSAQLPRFRDRLAAQISSLELPGENPLPRRANDLVDEMLREAHIFCRREGGESWQVAARNPDAARRFQLLWSDFFSARLLDWLQRHELTTDSEDLELADALVECAKIWIKDVSLHMTGSFHTDPMLPDTEQVRTVSLKRGPLELRIRGNPNASIRVKHDGEHVLLHHALSDVSRTETQIMQSLLNAALLADETPTDVALHIFRTRINEQAARFEDAVEDAFSGFHGNRAMVRRLKTKCAFARRRPVPRLLRPILLTGGTGCGKSDLVHRMAKAMEIPCIEVSGAFARRPADLVLAIRRGLSGVHASPGIGTPFILALDHVEHWQGQTADFMPLFAERQRRIVIDGDVCDISPVSVVIMAQSASQVPEAFLPKLQRLELDPYRPSEVAELVQALFQKQHLSLPDDAAEAMAKMARCTPGRSLDYARDLLERHTAAPRTVPLSVEGLASLAPRLWRVDESGLTQMDYLYLQALEAGPRGLPALQQLMPVSGDEITVGVEPFLFEIGAVQRTAKGRALTASGEQLVHRHRSRMEAARVEADPV